MITIMSNNKKKHDESENNMLIVSIQDTGIGINPRIKDQLFEKFATKSNQGYWTWSIFIKKNC